MPPNGRTSFTFSVPAGLLLSLLLHFRATVVSSQEPTPASDAGERPGGGTCVPCQFWTMTDEQSVQVHLQQLPWPLWDYTLCLQLKPDPTVLTKGPKMTILSYMGGPGNETTWSIYWRSVNPRLSYFFVPGPTGSLRGPGQVDRASEPDGWRQLCVTAARGEKSKVLFDGATPSAFPPPAAPLSLGGYITLGAPDALRDSQGFRGVVGGLQLYRVVYGAIKPDACHPGQVPLSLVASPHTAAAPESKQMDVADPPLDPCYTLVPSETVPNRTTTREPDSSLSSIPAEEMSSSFLMEGTSTESPHGFVEKISIQNSFLGLSTINKVAEVSSERTGEDAATRPTTAVHFADVTEKPISFKETSFTRDDLQAVSFQDSSNLETSTENDSSTTQTFDASTVSPVERLEKMNISTKDTKKLFVSPTLPTTGQNSSDAGDPFNVGPVKSDTNPEKGPTLGYFAILFYLGGVVSTLVPLGIFIYFCTRSKNRSKQRDHQELVVVRGSGGVGTRQSHRGSTRSAAARKSLSQGVGQLDDAESPKTPKDRVLSILFHEPKHTEPDRSVPPQNTASLKNGLPKNISGSEKTEEFLTKLEDGDNYESLDNYTPGRLACGGSPRAKINRRYCAAISINVNQ